MKTPMDTSGIVDPEGRDRMRLSTKSEYAFLALIDLAVNYGKGYVKIAEITEQRKIPRKYLEQIMLVLKGAGFVQSRMGPDGGYRLGKKPEDITMAEIIRLLDGALAPVLSVSQYYYQSSPVEQSTKMMEVFSQIRDYISNVMEHTTIQDLVPGNVSG